MVHVDDQIAYTESVRSYKVGVHLVLTPIRDPGCPWLYVKDPNRPKSCFMALTAFEGYKALNLPGFIQLYPRKEPQ